MRFTEFLLYAVGLMVFVAGFVYGIDRDMARRDYEHYNTSSQEVITGCIFESNCNYYNDLINKRHE